MRFCAIGETVGGRRPFRDLGMRERMEQIGGSLEVSSSSGKGTTVGAMLPLPPV
jgi:signal transduction histidine kinase